MKVDKKKFDKAMRIMSAADTERLNMTPRQKEKHVDDMLNKWAVGFYVLQQCVIVEKPPKETESDEDNALKENG